MVTVAARLHAAAGVPPPFMGQAQSQRRRRSENGLNTPTASDVARPAFASPMALPPLMPAASTVAPQSFALVSLDIAFALNHAGQQQPIWEAQVHHWLTILFPENAVPDERPPDPLGASPRLQRENPVVPASLTRKKLRPPIRSSALILI